VQNARAIRRRVGLAALAGAVTTLLAVAQPVVGSPPILPDTVHPNLERKLETLEASERTQVIVQLEERPTDTVIAALEREVGPLAVTRRFSIVNGFAASATRSQIEALARAPGVAQVEANGVFRASNDEAQAAFGVSKARLDLPSLDGAGVAIAVLDSGVDAAHSDLDQGKVIAFEDLTPNDRAQPYDDNGHGTHVSATAAGDGDGSGGGFRGVAPGASIVSVKVLNASLKGSGSVVIAGIDWVVANRNSFGVPIRMIVLSLQDELGACSGGTDTVSTAVNEAHALGLLVVVAAGNGGPGTCSIGAPAAAAGAFTVGAMADSSEGGFRLAPFSGRGPTLDGRIKPDVVAPGVGITSASRGSGYEARSGTSMAAPFVAGVAALMLDANAGLSSQQLKDTIRNSSVDWGRGGDNTVAGSTGQDIDYGAGRIDAYAAIRAAGAGLSSPPPSPAHEVHQGTVPAAAYVDHEISVNDTVFPMAATLIVPGPFPPDLDLALFNPSGTEVAASRTVGLVRQEQLAFQPSTEGKYTLRVSARSGAGAYFVDVSGATLSQAGNVAPPTIAGVTREGEILRAQPGAWSGGLPLDFAFQWLRCDGAGGACSPIPGIAGAEYQLTSGDIDATIRVSVTATNRAGSSSASSAQTGLVVPVPPRNVDPPSIVGTARDGGSLQAGRGSWNSSRALTIAYQWLRCRPGGGSCSEIPGATAATFGLGPADIGQSITVTVTAANAGGRESVTATPVSVGARRPEIATLPGIAGSARTGALLRAEEGTWTGTRPLKYRLRWERCGYNGRGCEPIRATTGRKYRVRANDAGTRLRLRVRASNSALPGGGAAFAYSRVTRIVQPAGAWFEAGAGRVVVRRGTRGSDAIRGTAGPDIIYGLGGNDRIVGRGGNDIIFGGPGHDVLLGGKGDDVLRGGAGNDTLNGGRGTDLLAGGSGKDTARGAHRFDALSQIDRRR
jgi:serine protease AprX